MKRPPDHGSLRRFREDVLTKKGAAFFEDLFRMLVREAKALGIEAGVVHALDATRIFVNVNADKPQDPKTPRDPDASWGCKENETRTATDGDKVQIPKYFYGFKAHLLAETAHGMVTGFLATPGHVADIDGGDDLLRKTLMDEERKRVRALLADKGCGCPVWINLLEKHTGIMTAFSLPKTMTERGEHQEKWRSHAQNEGRNAFKRDRCVIERINAGLKQRRGLGGARCLGLSKYRLQLTMSVVAHNLKIVMRLLYGVRLRPI